jgi:hypothetical protein
MSNAACRSRAQDLAGGQAQRQAVAAVDLDRGGRDFHRGFVGHERAMGLAPTSERIHAGTHGLAACKSRPSGHVLPSSRRTVGLAMTMMITVAQHRTLAAPPKRTVVVGYDGLAESREQLAGRSC